MSETSTPEAKQRKPLMPRQLLRLHFTNVVKQQGHDAAYAEKRWTAWKIEKGLPRKFDGGTDWDKVPADWIDQANKWTLAFLSPSPDGVVVDEPRPLLTYTTKESILEEIKAEPEAVFAILCADSFKKAKDLWGVMPSEDGRPAYQIELMKLMLERKPVEKLTSA